MATPVRSRLVTGLVAAARISWCHDRAAAVASASSGSVNQRGHRPRPWYTSAWSTTLDISTPALILGGYVHHARRNHGRQTRTRKFISVASGEKTKSEAGPLRISKKIRPQGARPGRCTKSTTANKNSPRRGENQRRYRHRRLSGSGGEALSWE